MELVNGRTRLAVHTVHVFFNRCRLKLQISRLFSSLLTFQAAVNVLEANGLVDGSFLIRNSIKCHGYYVISLVSERKVFHFQIKSRVRQTCLLSYDVSSLYTVCLFNTPDNLLFLQRYSNLQASY